MKRNDLLQEYLNEYSKKYWEEEFKKGEKEGVLIGKIQIVQMLLKDNEITQECADRRLPSLYLELEEITGGPIAEIESYTKQD